MKTEDRHELQTNELERLGQVSKKWLDQYQNFIIYGISAILVVAAVAIIWTNSARTAAEAGWSDLAGATTAEDFANVADKFSGRPVGNWARLLESESYLENGIQLSFTDRDGALSDLKQAEEGFKELLNNGGISNDVRERALFGFARWQETTSGSDTSAAVEAYDQLLSEFPNSVFKEKASEQIAALKAGRGQSFYTWFQKQHPKPADLSQPQDGIPTGATRLTPEQPTDGEAAPSETPDNGSSEAEPAANESTSEAPSEPSDESPSDDEAAQPQ